MTDLLLYAPQKLKPPVLDIIKAIVADYQEVTQVAEWHPDIATHYPMLCLGKVPENHNQENFVVTMTQPQVLSKSSAVTELKAALDLLLKRPTLRKFEWEKDPQVDLDKTLGNILVVDIETGGDIETWLPEEMWLLSCALYDGENLFLLSEEWLAQEDNRKELIRVLQNPKRKLVAHNMKFDFRSLSALLGVNIYGHLDTQLLHHAINPGAGEHGLKPLAAKYLGAPDWDMGSKQYVRGTYKVLPKEYFYPVDLFTKYTEKLGKVKVGFEAIPRDVLYEYNAWDVYWTWHLMEYLLKQSDERVRKVALHEYRMGNFFQDIESYGVAVDTQHLDALEEAFNEEKEGYMETLAELVSPDFNPNSPKQVKEVFASAGMELPNTSEGTLTDLQRRELPETVSKFIDTLLGVRGMNKMLGTYNTGIRKRMHSGRVYPTYKVHGTNTGRMSSTAPNIQNIPRDKRLRKLFTVKDIDKYDFLEVDYSQAELRTMAILSNDEYLMSLFQPGMPDFFDSLLPVTFPHHDIDSWTAQEKKDNRAKLKSVVYGLSYGRKGNAIAHELDIAVSEANAIISNYFKAAPQFYEWRQKVEREALKSDGVLETVFGRRFQSEIITTRSKTSVVNSALAFLPQSTASDICVSAAMDIHKWVGDYGGHIIGSIHDAILVESPKEYTETIARRMQKEMAQSAVRALGDAVPFDTDAEWGTSWGTTDNTFKEDE